MKECYIGNGITITVEMNKNGKAKILDIYKAMQLFAENYPKEVCIGMQSDWYFTAQRINSIADIENFPLMSSSWDSPAIEIDGERQLCYVELDADIKGYCYRDGYIHGVNKSTFWVPELVDCFHELEYDDIKILQKQINDCIDSFKDKRNGKMKEPISSKGKEYQKIIDDKAKNE